MSFIDIAIVIGVGAVAGAGIGAASSAMSGGDVGKGAAMGAIGGALTGGIGGVAGGGVGGLLGGAEGAAAGVGTEAAGALGSSVAPAIGSEVTSAGMTGAGELFGDLGVGTFGGIGENALNPAISSSLSGANVMGEGSLLSGVGSNLTGSGLISSGVAPELGSGIASNFTNQELQAVGNQLGQQGLANNPSAWQNALNVLSKNKGMLLQLSSLGGLYGGASNPNALSNPYGQSGQWNPLSYYKFDPRTFTPNRPTYIQPANYAEGGVASLNPNPDMMSSGPAKVDFMGSDAYPTSQQKLNFYSTPSQMPTSAQQAAASYEPATNPLTGEPLAHFAKGGFLGPLLDMDPVGKSVLQNTPGAIPPVIGKYIYGDLEDQTQMGTAPPQLPGMATSGLPGMAGGGIADLGSYSDGGQMTDGPGDGMSDSIPASIAGKRPARLAQGEFVVPADVVSHLGNGSTDAGAKQLYSMMDRVRKARTGRKSQGRQIRPAKMMPA